MAGDGTHLEGHGTSPEAFHCSRFVTSAMSPTCPHCDQRKLSRFLGLPMRCPLARGDSVDAVTVIAYTWALTCPLGRRTLNSFSTTKEDHSYLHSVPSEVVKSRSQGAQPTTSLVTVQSGHNGAKYASKSTIKQYPIIRYR